MVTTLSYMDFIAWHPGCDEEDYEKYLECRRNAGSKGKNRKNESFAPTYQVQNVRSHNDPHMHGSFEYPAPYPTVPSHQQYGHEMPPGGIQPNQHSSGYASMNRAAYNPPMPSMALNMVQHNNHHQAPNRGSLSPHDHGRRMQERIPYSIRDHDGLERHQHNRERPMCLPNGTMPVSPDQFPGQNHCAVPQAHGNHQFGAYTRQPVPGESSPRRSLPAVGARHHPFPPPHETSPAYGVGQAMTRQPLSQPYHHQEHDRIADPTSGYHPPIPPCSAVPRPRRYEPGTPDCRESLPWPWNGKDTPESIY